MTSSKACWLIFSGVLAALLGGSAARAQISPEQEAYWSLVHEDAVPADLKLSAAQKKDFRAALDAFDLRLLSLRNRPAAEASAGSTKIVAEARTALSQILTPQQQTRLDKLVVRQLGTRALQLERVRKALSLSAKQEMKIDQAIADSQSALMKLREPGAVKNYDEQNEKSTKIQNESRATILGTLSDSQKQKWASLSATDFDLARLGRTRFKVPELTGDAAAWRNSPPLSLAGQHGKVVVVHYFACGCINCVHNYPIYRKWHDELKGKDVTLIGIHTPETKSERDIAHLEHKIKEDELAFPILIDNDQANWNAWGNSMWPSVYILDKQGYLRHFWAGELKWQGAKGEELARDWIDRLLAE
jgi:peroxiredoxin